MATKSHALKVEVGTIDCPVCNMNIPVRKSTDTGTLHYPCMWCQNPGYAPAGTKAHTIIGSKLTPIAGAVDEAVRAPEPAPAPPAAKPPAPTPTPPAAKKPASIWHGLGAA